MATEDDNEEHGRGYLPPKKNLQIDEKSKRHFNRIMYQRTRTSIPQSYSSVDKGLVSPVRHQRNCGSCVAFATAAVIETCYKKKSGVFDDYSEQELVDCAYGEYGASGCDGAYADSYARWADKKKRQLTLELNYPYIGKHSTYICPRILEPFNHGAKITGHYYEPHGNEEELKAAIFKHGAVISCMHSGSKEIDNYSGGVFDGCKPDDEVDHCVAVVGYGTEGGVDYWLIKNSWGPNWGENGFMKLKRGVKMCGIGEEIVTITCKKNYTPPCNDMIPDCNWAAPDFCDIDIISRYCKKSCRNC